MESAIVPWSAARGYDRGLRVGVSGEEMSGSSLAGGGSSLLYHLVYLRLLEEGDCWADSEEPKEPGEAVLYVHRVLPVTVGVSLNECGCE